MASGVADPPQRDHRLEPDRRLGVLEQRDQRLDGDRHGPLAQARAAWARTSRLGDLSASISGSLASGVPPAIASSTQTRCRFASGSVFGVRERGRDGRRVRPCPAGSGPSGPDSRSLNEGWSSCRIWASIGSESLPRGPGLAGAGPS